MFTKAGSSGLGSQAEGEITERLLPGLCPARSPVERHTAPRPVERHTAPRPDATHRGAGAEASPAVAHN